MRRIFNLTLLSGSPHCAPGNCYFFSHDVLLLHLLLAFKALDPQSFLVKEGVTCYLCRMSYYCRSTTSSTPYNLLKPWTFGQQKPFFGWFLILRPHCHFFVVRGFIYMRRRLSRVSHMTHPHHGTAPSCFCTVQNTTSYLNSHVV